MGEAKVVVCCGSCGLSVGSGEVADESERQSSSSGGFEEQTFKERCPAVVCPIKN